MHASLFLKEEITRHHASPVIPVLHGPEIGSHQVAVTDINLSKALDTKMTKWKRIIEAWNALPEADRTTDKVHAKLLEQGHSISPYEVQTVLCATVVSDLLDESDLRVTARTLRIL